mgnify:CR=1 FL=1
MIHFGKLDTGIPPEKVQKVKKYSESIKSELIIHEYDEAEHGFNCQDRKSFNKKASDKEIVELNKAITHVANLMGSKDKGYRALTNIGSDGGQEVPHLHFHIFAGEKIGKMVS